jgi:phosphoribosyl-dephospho-CoA transferase
MFSSPFPLLQRHQLAHLSDEGWEELTERERDATAHACLTHWSIQHLPLVVTRQALDQPAGMLSLGLPAPTQWQRRRIALRVPAKHVIEISEFPPAGAVVEQLPPALQTTWLGLCAALTRLGVAARVHGSVGMQHLTGLPYLHADSDIDLNLPVQSVAMADNVVALLAAAALAQPRRLDGELRLPDGGAVAWREWQPWRQGRVDSLLVKRLHGVALETGEAWMHAEPTP